MTGSSSNNPATDPPASPVPFAFVEGALDRADALRDDPAALASAREGAARARDELTWDASAAAHMALYEELL